jgi:hypothetical protein
MKKENQLGAQYYRHVTLRQAGTEESFIQKWPGFEHLHNKGTSNSYTVL